MLCILTGDVQTGKTRWLCGLVDELDGMGVSCYGVLAPGVWVEHGDSSADGRSFEKRGICNVLLPDRDEVPFAVRFDLADGARESAQSDDARLGWKIFDDSIALVNGHLAALPAIAARYGRPGLLVIDELGRLELLRGQGLVRAVELLEEGPTKAFPHALVVVRSCLVDAAETRFASQWGGAVRIGPDDAGRDIVLSLSM